MKGNQSLKATSMVMRLKNLQTHNKSRCKCVPMASREFTTVNYPRVC